jgi:porin
MYELGGWYDNSRYQRLLNDDDGAPALISGQPLGTGKGRAGAFARFEQQLTGAAPGSGLTLFGAYLQNVSGEAVMSRYMHVGFVQTGTFSGRSSDSIGFVYSRQQFSEEMLEAWRTSRARAGGSGTPDRYESMIELNYGIQLTPTFRIQPNLQYVVHPDQIPDPDRLRDLPNALALGLRLDWNPF